MAYIGKEPIIGNFQKCDAISVVNGQAAYTLQVSSTNVVPESANHMLVSLNGILQAPVTSFTVSGSTLTFASNLATGDVIDFVILLGNVLDLGVPSDDTVGAAQIKNDLISGTTALASEPADTDEFLVSDAGTLKRIDYSLIKSAGNTPGFEVYRGSNLSVNTGSWTKITHDNETIDTDSAFASNKFTVPSGEGGKYFFFAAVEFAQDDRQVRLHAIYKNGSAVKHLSKHHGIADSQMQISGACFLDLSATDYVEHYVYQNAGDAINVIGGATATYFGGFKVS